ncbi:MAG: ECF subfamily RNA polymerase sigma factor, RNA polymerase sigma-70 factor, ECF subfamily [Candidatus Gottesmanbacteria bacterium GW2011_GWA2_43_14]|uniref:RNA polymerase sigma factor n=1 Tax=Candidatus Gottesmanbacteria bacterium GW2011_GWA2_43_14 TaxID=1618443 RepID=A0A0G1FJI5_9BACT|nr:MAG: ECF subfamily RNA polymerase sigma factor, RNA polymerase sigma-70 factor, ECF subfamily [Candidatus Gottesmanbacteria bacterium GW2011_GWA2_43_14]
MDKLNNLSDEEVVSLVINENKEVYGQIVDRYERKLRRYIMTFTKKQNDADDILQNVFIKAYKNLTTYDRKLKFSSWIYRITHNESLNLVNSSFLQRIVSLQDWLVVEAHEDIEDKIDSEMLKIQLKGCIDRLEIKYKEPLILNLYEEKSHDEISDILRIPVRNVGVLIHRAKTKVKEICHEKHNKK